MSPSDSVDVAAAHAEIRNLLAAYHFYGDGGEADGLAGLFTADGIMRTADTGTYEGRAAIASFLRERHARRDAVDSQLTRSRHHLATIYIEECGPDSARVHSYFQVITQRGVDHWGSYDDDLRVEDGRWRFAVRSARVEGQADESWRSA